MARALSLLEHIGAGRPVGRLNDVYARPAAPLSIDLRRDRLARLLGDTVPDVSVERILTQLGFLVIPTSGGWQVGVPPRRVDVRRDADLVEEVGRHWGFDRIPATFPALRSAPPPPAPGVTRGRLVRRLLASAGLQEAVTFTFIEQSAAAPFSPDSAAAIPIANPLSEKFAVLRPSLLPGLVDSLIYNRRREIEDVRLFETGSIFGEGGERQSVGWVLTGARGSHWSGDAGRLDFFDAKGTAELLASAFGATLTAEMADDVPGFVRGRTARLSALTPDALIVAGVIGELRSDVLTERGLPSGEAVVAGELDLSALALLGAHAHTAIEPLPRHPSIVRDLSIIIDERLPAEQVRGTIRAIAPPTLVAVREFDRYQGQGVPEGRVSLAIRLTFRAAERTLTDSEVQQAVDAVVAALAREHQAILRGK
jgi:phenylalanyl-tRNA synthetase beta chain